MDQPNIVFVFADQLRSHNLGCYGDQQVKTPHFDRLAKEGLRFTNAISTHPVCGPFRGMLMTGNFPIKNGLLLTDHFLKNPDPYFAEVCKAQGYQTAYIGKWHLDGEGRESYIPPDRRLGFEHWRTLECTHNYFESKYFFEDESTPSIWGDYDAISQTEDACSYIQNQHDPFCLFLSWGPPHDPYIAPDKNMEAWNDRSISLRKNVNDFNTNEDFWKLSDTVLTEKFRGMRERERAVQKEEDSSTYLKRTRGYYAAIETIDDCMGEILNTLEQSGKLDNTIIVFTSDHGDNLGSHRQTGKQLPFEESISIPLLIRFPPKLSAGMVDQALVRPVDLMPTVLDLAGIPCHSIDGRTMNPHTREDEPQGVLIQKCLALSVNWITNGNGPWAGVRTSTHTYARLTNSNTPWVLYDNTVDPYQMNNLIGREEYAHLQGELDQMTTNLLAEAKEPEDPKVYADIILKECEKHPTNSRGPELTPDLIST